MVLDVSRAHAYTHARAFIAASLQLWVCKSKYCSKAASCSGYVNIQSASESDLMDATANIGPVRYCSTNNTLLYIIYACMHEGQYPIYAAQKGPSIFDI